MENITPVRRQQNDFLTIPDLWRICVAHWYWFAVSLTVCIAIACYYLAVTPKLYTREAAVMVKQELMGKNAGKNLGGDEFNDIGMVQQTTSVTNIQRRLTSLDVLTEVVRRLGLADNEQEVMRVAQSIKGRVTADLKDDKSTIIYLKYYAPSVTNADNVLNKIVEVFNDKWREGKNEMTANTSRFIQERLSLLENDLGIVDDSISSFKARNKITDLNRVSDIYLQKQSTSEAHILTLTNQRSIALYILSILEDKSTQHQMLPTNSGINNPVAETQINQYNSMLLQLKNNMYNTSDQNPLILKQESELKEVRKNIAATISNHIKSIDIQLSTYQAASGEADNKITQNPNQAKYLLSVEREQKVKESLYLYLLQKKEENEINKTYTSNITQFIDMPHGSAIPTSPKSRNVLLAAILLGVIFPVSILFVRESMNSTIRSKHDIERKTSLLLLGEIPMYREKKGWLSRLMPVGRKRLKNIIVVASDKSDMVNDAFRILRSKLEFMTSRHSSKNIYTITSDYAGSGKTFISTNLSLVMAIKGHNVLLIDGDLRHASASHHFNCTESGLADYLNEEVTDIDSLLVKHPDYPSLSILPVGTIPPNPTELLSGERFAQMLNEMRARFDFIIIDCPPNENMADASIIESHADRTLFVVRAGVYERKHIYDLEADVLNGKHKNLTIILNGTEMLNSGNVRYNYGYYGSNR